MFLFFSLLVSSDFNFFSSGVLLSMIFLAVSVRVCVSLVLLKLTTDCCCFFWLQGQKIEVRNVMSVDLFCSWCMLNVV